MRRLSLFLLAGMLAACGGHSNVGATGSPAPAARGASGSPSARASGSVKPSGASTAKGSTKATPKSGGTSGTTAAATATPKATASGTRIPACYHEISIVAVTAKSTYSKGQPIVITLKATNTSKHSCVVTLNKCLQIASVSAEWKSWHKGQSCPTADHKVLQPKASASAARTWNQRKCDGEGCSGTQVKSGFYEAGGTWKLSYGSSLSAAPQSFRIT